MAESRPESLRVLTTLPERALGRVTDALPWVEIVAVPAEAPPPEGVRADVLLIPPWDPGHLDALLGTGVRWIHTVGTGVDRLPLARLGDCLVTCSRGASGVPIAEWVLAVVLAFAKGLPDVWLDGPPGEEGPAMPPVRGLHGSRLGLIGLGGIGSAVAHRARSFGMEVRALRRTGAAAPVEGVVLVSDLAALLADADHLVLAVPLTPATRHLVDHDALAAIPPGRGLHLVNVARGGLIDQEALRSALDDGRVARATLDVTDPEPLPAGHWMYAHPNVRISPHVSWRAPEAFALILDTFVDNLRRFRAGEPLAGRVDREAGY